MDELHGICTHCKSNDHAHCVGRLEQDGVVFVCECECRKESDAQAK